MSDKLDFKKCEGFDWDAGNQQKSWAKHRVDYRECEELFFNKPLLLHEDKSHSGHEARYYALGATNTGRPIFLVFTIRGRKLRVISARDQSRRERRDYEKANDQKT